MATQSVVVVPDTFLNIVTHFSLATGKRYIVQNLSLRNLYIGEYSAAPTAMNVPYSHFVPPGEYWSITVGSDGIYVWTQDPNCIIVVTEG